MQLKRKPSLGRLTSAALALPGLAVAQEPGALQTDYLFSYYREADLPAGRVLEGDKERYQIRSHNFRAVQPFDERRLSFDLVYERLTGASPWYVQPDPDNDNAPAVVMSQATIEETRWDVSVGGSSPITDTLAANLSAGYSTEDDYRAAYGNAELEFNPGDGAWTLFGGVGYSRDRLDPTVGVNVPSIPAEETERKRTVRVNAGATYVLNRWTLLQGSWGFQDHSGFLTDPYKRVWTAATGPTEEARPDGRRSHHFLARARHFVEALQGALHLDYRYFRDDWKIRSHNVELTWHQTLPDFWRVSPGLRWYSQSQAFFYAPFFDDVPAHGFRSSDYRLSPYGALSYRLDVTKGWNSWAFGMGVEHYEARGSYAAGSVRVENPALVRYTIFTARLAASF